MAPRIVTEQLKRCHPTLVSVEVPCPEQFLVKVAASLCLHAPLHMLAVCLPGLAQAFDRDAPVDPKTNSSGAQHLTYVGGMQPFAGIAFGDGAEQRCCWPYNKSTPHRHPALQPGAGRRIDHELALRCPLSSQNDETSQSRLGVSPLESENLTHLELGSVRQHDNGAIANIGRRSAERSQQRVDVSLGKDFSWEGQTVVRRRMAPSIANAV
jgi:hypothetical protein